MIRVTTLTKGERAFLRRLRDVCEQRGIGQNELARQLGASPGSVHQWFSVDAPAMPRAVYLLELPRVLDVDGHWLLTGTDRSA